MLNKLSLRYKIVVSYLLIFAVFMLLMYLFATQVVEEIVVNSMYVQANQLIARLKNAENDDELIQSLRDQKYLIFFRVGIINDEMHLIYDSYKKRLIETGRDAPTLLQYPEVAQALKSGVGISERESKNLNQGFVYMAKTFDFHGKTYILRTAFPTTFVSDLTENIRWGLLGFSTMILLLFGMISWYVMNRLTSPIHEIIKGITPYQEGKTQTIPEIRIHRQLGADEFSQLANTLNSLSAKIQSQINSLTHERNEKEAVLESLVEGVIAVDEHLNVTYANHTALRLLDTTWNQLVDHAIHTAGQPKFIQMLEECQELRKPIHDMLELKNKHQEVIHLEITAAPQKGLGAILVMEDKSEHYKLLDMRRDFIANASHELKTPITIIHGFAETLHDNPTLPSATYQSITEKMMRNCQRMTNIIKDLLALTDIENIAALKLEYCDLEQIVSHCKQMVQDLYPEAHIEIENPNSERLSLQGDSHLLEMAFMNLIENACKYSNPPAHVKITLSSVGDSLQAVIADKGIGIPKEDLKHIFERFYTVDKARSRKMGGSGLGLSIVSSIVEKHHGQISVTSQVGEGTTFVLVLPKTLL